ncbi:MAG: filamentous hemagglutinin N-terminal domain-containing protein [Chlamydiales bacterium]
MRRLFKAGLWVCPLFLCANPEGFRLKAGDAKPPVSDGAGTVVIESGQKAIVEWDSFSIGEGEHVRFQQAGADAAILNRVIGPAESAIFGRLSSNGAVYLINPNGILIGPNGSVEAMSFIGSTMDLLDRDFLEARGLCFQGGGLGEIVVQGEAKTAGGDLILISRRVNNGGNLTADGGDVALLSGTKILIQPLGKRLIYIAPAAGVELDALKVLASPYETAIRHSGKIEARMVVSRGGEVYLIADEGASEVSGTIVAAKGDKGGHVEVLGERVHLVGQARIDASGMTGGGEVLVGGDDQGQNGEVKNALLTWAGKMVEVRADALKNGKGGKVVFWGD